MNISGTPKTLDEAIEQALCVGPLSEIKERLYHVIKDYMSQKFQAAMLENGAMEEELLKDLFKKLTKRPK